MKLEFCGGDVDKMFPTPEVSARMAFAASTPFIIGISKSSTTTCPAVTLKGQKVSSHDLSNVYVVGCVIECFPLM